MKNLNLKINGVPHQFVVEEDRVLIDILREDLQLTGTKQGCDRKGQCGACTVIANGKTVLSCRVKAASLDGAEVITVEGLGTPDNPHLIQEAFVLSGAIQCGFCTPGLIMSTKALLDKNLNPSRDEIRKAMRGHLCRCTGYERLIDAVELAGRFLRGETTPAKETPDANGPQIGVSHPRPWSMFKACGVAKFAADIILPDALELALVSSPHHNARIKGIDYTRAAKMPGVVGIVTADDIKGNNTSGRQKPILCKDMAPVLGAHVAIVAARTKREALAAAAKVKVDYEVLPRVGTIAEAMAENAPEVDPGSPNVRFQKKQIKGDAGKALGSGATVIDAEFNTQFVHQAPLEPEVALAYMDGEGDAAQLVIIGRSIRIHDHVKALKDGLGWGNIRYQEAFVGGQFGIKIDLTSEHIAGAAALHFRRPVRFVPSTTESMYMTSKRHPFHMKVKMGAGKDGKLTGYEMYATVEKGAYTSSADTVTSRTLAMLSGGYNIPNIFADVKMVYTNNCWGGSARGAGPPQPNYALECAVDLLAIRMKQDPLEFRIQNSLQPGQTTSNGQVAEEWALNDCLKRLKPEYERAKKEAAAHKTGATRRGVGVAASAYGIGFPNDKSDVAVELDDDGGITVFASVADPGEGNDAMLTQIAAHAMAIPREKVRLVTRDSAITPNSGMSASSRETFMAGNALLKAIEDLKAAMAETGAKTAPDLVKAGKPVRYQGSSASPCKGMDPENGQGDYFAIRCHGVQMAEVEVNKESGEVKVLKMTSVVDCGTIINPLAVIGQIEGGIDMGAGFALREEYVHGKTVDWVSYKYPTFRDSFPKETIMLESPRSNGPLGATGIGEFTLMPTAPAILNAVHNATGARVYDLPATPERVLQAIEKAEQGDGIWDSAAC